MKLKSFLLLSFWTALFSLTVRAETSHVIGVSAPLTGESAAFGEDIKNVLLFARDYFGDHHVKLDIQDDMCSGKNGVMVAQYFVNKNVAAVIGYACVEAIMPAIPPLRRAGIPVISLLASGPDITGPGLDVFNLYPSDKLGVKTIIKRLNDLNINNLLVLTSESAFPVGITNAFKNEIKNSNITASYVNYPEHSTDFVPMISRMMAEHTFQGVFINYSNASEFIAFMKQRKLLRLTGPVFTSYLNGYESIKQDGLLELIENVEFYDTAPLEENLSIEERVIFDSYVKKYGHLKSSDGYFSFIFNGYAAMRTALAEGKGIAKSFQEKTFSEGLKPTFSFDSEGNVKGGIPFVMKKIIGGKPQLIN